MNATFKIFAASILATVFAASGCLAQQITVKPDKETGIYDINQPITWRIDVQGDHASSITSAHYALKRCGLTVLRQGTVDLSTGSATIQASLDEPGTILLDITANVDGRTIRGLGGAAISPDKIQPSARCPDDFDQFWAAKINELHQVPANPQLESADSGNPTLEYFKLRMDNIHGAHIYGQLAKPKKEGKFPALLIPQWAGVYGLPRSRVIEQARKGWLTLNIMPHDLPFDQPEDYYKHLFATTFKNYWTFGSDSRETTYFLPMYLSCYRAAEYLSQRDDWDGKTLVVMGASQGGQQAIMVAALFPRITAVMAVVPSSCDVTGPSLGRAIGYPNWADQANEKHNEKILQTGRYFDPVNFASRVKCPALVAMGLLDETSPATGVFAACNQLNGPKQVLVLVNSNHAGDHNAQAPFFHRADQWLAKLAKGEPVP